MKKSGPDHTTTPAPNRIFAIDFEAEIEFSDLTRIRKKLGIPTQPNLGTYTARSIIGHLVESGAWGDCWLTMIQLGPESFRLVLSSDREHVDKLEEALSLSEKIVKILGGVVVSEERSFEEELLVAA